MMVTCKIEDCFNMVENPDNGLCAKHNREARKKAAPKEKPRKTRISKQSEEGKERMAVYMAIRKMYLAVNGGCRPCWVDSGYIHSATEIHHARGKQGDLLYDIRYFVPCCSACHRRIHDYHAEAVEKGWSLSRHQNETI